MNKITRVIKTLNAPSYVIFFVTARCNAKCRMCFYADNMAKSAGMGAELSLEEYEKISKSIKLINMLGISGGEPFLRSDLSEIVKILYRNCSPMVVDLPTNGYFTDSILRQVESIADYCRDMTVDVQLSIDGPEEVHNEIRGLKDSFSKVKETYKGLVALKKKYKNLKLKACTVYSHYNQGCIDELFEILERDFSELDRVVFSVAHGSVSNDEAMDFDWNRYFKHCDNIRNNARVQNIGDFHSAFTLALRMVKNDYLKDILQKKDFYKECGSGRKVIVIGETGKVFPCEPLWEAVGDLRSNGYDLGAILRSREMMEFIAKTASEKCNCHWGLPMSTNLIYKPSYYPAIISEFVKIVLRSLAGRDGGKKARHVF